MGSEDTDARPQSSRPPAIVGIGASAGGLNALREFFDHVPADSGLAYVVVVHLSPDHESHLAEILQPHARIPVQQVTQTVKLEADQVYVIPPNANLDAVDTHLRLTHLEEQRRERAPIDHFLRTLARTHDGHSIGVILTGTGSDGTLGIREIKEKNGLTIVQEPNEAEFDGMPQSALATGIIDLVLPLAKIPAAILRFVYTQPEVPASEEEAEDETRRLLQKIFAQLRVRTGRDFSRYKRSTLLRRIGRRMQLAHLQELSSYLELLRKKPEEVRALADEILINVTSFFRDTEVFEILDAQVIPQLFEGKNVEDDIRLWSVGCATGEEAYSLAILLLEEAARRDFTPRLQVFASDLHEHSLGRARGGFYPGDIETDVSPERLRRFFIKEDGGYRIREEVREIVVFAPHNLLNDPPFSKIDLITCRNVLIYLQRDVQQEVIELFHFALRPDGFLTLGTAETVDDGGLFRTLDKKCCVYQKRNTAAPRPRLPIFPVLSHRSSARGPSLADDQISEPPSYGSLHQRMVEMYAPPSLLVSPDDKIVHLSERAGRYLVHPGGEITTNVFRLVREEFQIELRAAIHRVRKTQEASCSRPIAVQFDGQRCHIVLRVQPALEPRRDDFVLVIFDEQPEVLEPVDRDTEQERSPGHQQQIEELEAELTLTSQRLQSIIEEYETNQEEMKASNEELQSANEELRSTMEELETSKEELQSMNEELQTVNQENRHKVDELAQLSGDLQNLLSSTDIATLFLDRELRIMRFTPRVSEIFSIRQTDCGRPLADLTHRLGYDTLLQDAQQVLHRLVPVEREVQDDAGRWYLTRVRPYRSTEDRIEGVVITFVDITERSSFEDTLRESEERFRALVDASAQMVWTTDAQGSVVEDSPSWRAYTGQRLVEWEGRGWLDAIHPDDQPWVEAQWREAVEQERPVTGEARVYHAPSDACRWVAVRAVPLRHADGSTRGWVGMGIDIHERKLAEDERDRERALLTAMLEALPAGVLIADRAGQIVRDNAAAREIWGAPIEATSWRDYGDWTGWWPDTGARIRAEEWPMSRALLHGEVIRGELVQHEQPGGGEQRCFLHNGASIRDGEGEVVGAVVVMLDVSDRLAAEQALRQSEERFRAVAHLVPDLLWRSEPGGDVTWFNHRWAEYTGQPAEEAEGWGWLELIHPEDHEQIRTTYQQAVDTGQPAKYQYRLRRRDGAYRWFITRVEPVHDEDGEIQHWLGAATDVQEQRTALDMLEERVETRTRQVRELARKLTMVEQEERRRFAHILHDDLQQLLYGMEMKLGLIRADLEEAAQPRLVDDLDEARGWIAQALAMTRQLTVDLTPPVLESDGLVDALRWLQPHMRDLHGLEVELEAAHRFHVLDQDLRVLLFQIVRELLFNIKKHAGVEKAKVQLEEDDEHLILRVSDDGCGFELEELTAREPEGGFGLFSIRERLGLLGGSLELHSHPGEGTRATVRMPMKIVAGDETTP